MVSVNLKASTPLFATPIPSLVQKIVAGLVRPRPFVPVAGLCGSTTNTTRYGFVWKVGTSRDHKLVMQKMMINPPKTGNIPNCSEDIFRDTKNPTIFLKKQWWPTIKFGDNFRETTCWTAGYRPPGTDQVYQVWAKRRAGPSWMIWMTFRLQFGWFWVSPYSIRTLW
jgi:hypothetical protein